MKIEDFTEDYLKSFLSQYETPFYIFDENGFVENYNNLEKSFQAYYSNYRISYSFKSNYMPYICKLVLNQGGYAEVVSDFEYYVAKKSGFSEDRIIYNGPCKQNFIFSHMEKSGILNVDNEDELNRVIEYCNNNKDRKYQVGIRANFDVGQNYKSRFGLEVEEWKKLKTLVEKMDNLEITGIHYHIGQSRDLKYWKERARKILEVSDYLFSNTPPKYIDLGSGMFGDMEESFRLQFGNDVPRYSDYALAVADAFEKHFGDLGDEKPLLFTEPGATLVSRYMYLVSSVVSKKKIDGRRIIGMDSCFFNSGETSRYKKLPINVLSSSKDINISDLVGYTCLEDDVLYKDYQGPIEVGDIVVLGNVGGYSLVFKPPFIMPDLRVVAAFGKEMKEIKHPQSFDRMLEDYVL